MGRALLGEVRDGRGQHWERGWLTLRVGRRMSWCSRSYFWRWAFVSHWQPKQQMANGDTPSERIWTRDQEGPSQHLKAFTWFTSSISRMLDVGLNWYPANNMDSLWYFPCLLCSNSILLYRGRNLVLRTFEATCILRDQDSWSWHRQYCTVIIQFYKRLKM